MGRCNMHDKSNNALGYMSPLRLSWVKRVASETGGNIKSSGEALARPAYPLA
jgi:hypothetical protein